MSIQKQLNDLLKIRAMMARDNLLLFARHNDDQFTSTNFHKVYYHILQLFAEGKIKKLIVTMPPQHGKSHGSTRMLPSYMLGRNKNTRIAVCSYSDSFARKFNREIKRIIKSKTYKQIFSKTKLNSESRGNTGYIETAREFEIVDGRGGLKSVGRGGELTGNPVDIGLLDDIYKDYAEGNSPVIREKSWDWYIAVFRARLHNLSQQLIVFTRWHEDDLIGLLERTEEVVEIKSFSDLENIPAGAWVKINFEAIKESEPTEIDPRKRGEALWPDRHSLDRLIAQRNLDPDKFSCLYQGTPLNSSGLLYRKFKTYSEIPNVVKKGNYTDTADEGTDYLCSICYDKDRDNNIYVTDVLYTQESMESTEEWTANMIKRNGTKHSFIESNNGGKGFARAVKKLVYCPIEWFHQSGNKESRVMTNKEAVMDKIYFPSDWSVRWPEFYAHLTRFKKNFKANDHDDAPDTLTGIIEKEVYKEGVKRKSFKRVN